MLTNLLVHQLSFFKDLVKIINTLVSIQRCFLWSSSANKIGMAWIFWKSFCKTKEFGGLGIKEVGVFNRALITKWLWRFIHEPNAIRKGIIESRYGCLKSRILLKRCLRRVILEYLWWRDVVDMEDVEEEEGFLRQLSCKVGDGSFVSF